MSATRTACSQTTFGQRLRFETQSVGRTFHLALRHVWLWACVTALAAMPFVAQTTRAAVTEAWVHRYNNVLSNAEDQAFKVVRDAAGDIIVIGTTKDSTSRADMLTIKYSGADGSVLWQKRYDGPAHSDDLAQAVAVDGSGNVVVTGSSYRGISEQTSDYYTAKYAAADGALLWEKRFRGPGASESDPARAVAVAVDGSGNVVITGSSGNGDAPFGTVRDYYTAKYAAVDGALLWEKHYNGPANRYDEARAVVVDGGGNVVVTGYSRGSSSGPDYYTAKYAAADGTLLWEKRYNGPANIYDYANAIAVDDNANVVVTGASQGEYYTAKYAAADGALLWEKRYSGSGFYDSASAVAVDRSGNVVVAGSSVGLGGSTGDYYTAKYAAADGALLWEQRDNGPANSQDVAQAVAVDGNGNVVVTGYSYGGSSLPDYYTAKYAAADGTILWKQRYNGPANGEDSANAVVVDGSGNVVVTGSSHNGANNDCYTAKYAAADGALLWAQRYSGQANRDDHANAVAMDSSGNVVVTGSSTGSASTFDYYTGNYPTAYYTAKYAAADGALLWEKRYHRSANSQDTAQAVAVDGSDNVIVTGGSTIKYLADGTAVWTNNGGGTALAVDGSDNVVVTGGSTIKYLADGTAVWTNNGGGTALAVDGNGNVVVTGYSGNASNFDYRTAKYAATDGRLLWEQRYNGPANHEDYATAIAVDGNGNVVVTGYSSGSGPYEFDYYTAKYAAANGALLWEKRYDGPARYLDQARAVAVDAGGNVVVTGSSIGNNIGFDYYTAKYAAADGALLWEKRYRADYANAVAVDGSGNVVVTGYSHNGTNNDYCTAKYAAADGALLWEKRYNGPANGDDSVNNSRSLALGPNGMVAITGSSSGDYATVVYRDLNARDIKENVLTELIALRAAVTNRNDGRKLDEAIRHLTRSLVARFWVDETHLKRRHGRKVFHEEKLTVTKLCHLINSRTSDVSEALLQGFIDRIFQADRLLATVAIDDAITAGVSNKKIEQAQRFLARGDAASADDKCSNGIEDYGKAWRRVTR